MYEKLQNGLNRCWFWADVYISSGETVFIFGSTDATVVQLSAGIQKIRCNMLHHLTEIRPKISGFWLTLWNWEGLELCY